MYDELVQRLRERCVFLFPHHGESRSYDADLMHEATDAIEELQKQIDGWVELERKALLKEIKKLKGGKTMDSNKYYIIRTEQAGVFFGHIKERTGNEVTMTDVRRIWYWEGAASLSQMAVDGVSRPHDCKFTVTVPEMTILGVIEIIPCTDKAMDSILEVKEWRA